MKFRKASPSWLLLSQTCRRLSLTYAALRPIAYCLLVIGCCLFSCKRDTAPGIDFGYGYFPNTVGKSVIYNVDSIVCSNFDYKRDTFRYMLKEVVQSLFNDNSNRPTMRIERYIKNFNNLTKSYDTAWTLKNVWTANRTSTTAEKVESNVRFVKLVFPVVVNKTWNGNAFNTLGEWDYYYNSVNQPSAVSDSVLTVVQMNSFNAVTYQYYVEMYAKNIGLIYKKETDVSFDSGYFNPVTKIINPGPVLDTATGLSMVSLPSNLTSGTLNYQQTICQTCK